MSKIIKSPITVNKLNIGKHTTLFLQRYLEGGLDKALPKELSDPYSNEDKENPYIKLTYLSPHLNSCIDFKAPEPSVKSLSPQHHSIDYQIVFFSRNLEIMLSGTQSSKNDALRFEVPITRAIHHGYNRSFYKNSIEPYVVDSIIKEVSNAIITPNHLFQIPCYHKNKKDHRKIIITDIFPYASRNASDIARRFYSLDVAAHTIQNYIKQQDQIIIEKGEVIGKKMAENALNQPNKYTIVEKQWHYHSDI